MHKDLHEPNTVHCEPCDMVNVLHLGGIEDTSKGWPSSSMERERGVAETNIEGTLAGLMCLIRSFSLGCFPARKL